MLSSAVAGESLADSIRAQLEPEGEGVERFVSSNPNVSTQRGRQHNGHGTDGSVRRCTVYYFLA